MNLRYLSISQLAEVTDTDRRTVTKRLAEMRPHSKEGRAILYPAGEAVRRILNVQSTEPIDRKLAKIELEIEEEKLERIRIENAQSRGELVSMEEVCKEVERQYSIVRSQIRAIPSKLAKPLSMISDPHEVFNRLSESIDETLTELSADGMYLNELQRLQSISTENSEVPGESIQAVAETESGSMGGHVQVSEPGK